MAVDPSLALLVRAYKHHLVPLEIALPFAYYTFPLLFLRPAGTVWQNLNSV